jgi:hypothetical protein
MEEVDTDKYTVILRRLDGANVNGTFGFRGLWGELTHKNWPGYCREGQTVALALTWASRLLHHREHGVSGRELLGIEASMGTTTPTTYAEGPL